MRSFKKLASRLVLVGVLAVSVFGCGKLTTATNPVQTAVTATASSPAQSEGLLSGLGGILNTVVGLIVRTLNLVGSLGGSLDNGRWHVVVPAGAVGCRVVGPDGPGTPPHDDRSRSGHA